MMVKTWVLATFLLLSGGGQAYELAFSEVGTNACQTCVFCPINSRMYVLDICGEKSGTLYYDEGSSNRLCSRKECLSGVISNEYATITVGKNGADGVYLFKNGKLSRYSNNAKEKGPDDDEVRKLLTADLSDKGRRKQIWRCVDHSKDGYRYWKDSGRLRLWFTNPNEAGGLFALCAALFLGIGLAVGGFKRLIFSVLTGASVYALFLTGSRGGFVGLFLAALVQIACRFREIVFKKRVWMPVFGLVAIAIFAFVYFGGAEALDRYVSEDLGTVVRVSRWVAGPRLIFNAPWGWWRPAGHCYSDWFQDFCDDYRTKYLVNSHFSFMANSGWILSTLYLFAWIFILGLLFREAWRGKRVTVLGVWIALAVTMWFSTIGFYNPELWFLAVPVLVYSLCRQLFGKWKWKRLLLLSGGGAVGLLLLILGVGYFMEIRSSAPFLVRRIPGGVRIGQGEVSTYLVDDDQVLTGGYVGPLGKELRMNRLAHPDAGAFVLADSLDDVPDGVERLILSGARCTDYLERYYLKTAYPNAGKIWFLSPDFPPSYVPPKLLKDCDVRWIIGELAVNLLKGYRTPRSWVTIVPGAALYIPDWLERVGL